MNNFCTKCGAELNGKSKCEKCGNVNGGALQNIADKVKNYDYKSKADELKAKANEAVDKAKAYDYKGKAEEIKEAAKNYDYKEKAKEISESVKNYDYKAETENIKKGGIKYFWNKHRKLSIAIICVIAIGCISGIFGDEESTNNTAGTTSSENSVKSDTKFIRDDDFIMEYAEKLNRMYTYKIVDMDKYNRYLIKATIKDDYAKYTTDEGQAIIFEIYDDYQVENYMRSTTNKKLLDSEVSNMKSYIVWNLNPATTKKPVTTKYYE